MASCIITMKKLQGMCGGPNEASAVLNYFSGLGKARYLSITKNEFLEVLNMVCSFYFVHGNFLFCHHTSVV